MYSIYQCALDGGYTSGVNVKRCRKLNYFRLSKLVWWGFNIVQEDQYCGVDASRGQTFKLFS